jgi:hypothetical protein
MENSEYVEWRDIEGYEKRYQVSADGKVRSLLSKNGKPKILKPGKVGPRRNYLRVNLRLNGKSKGVSVHRLVGFAFVEGRSEYNSIINHKNGIGSDNRAENLEWCSHMHNTWHAQEIGLMKKSKGESTEKKRYTIFMNHELATRVLATAARKDVSLSELFKEIAEAYFHKLKYISE